MPANRVVPWAEARPYESELRYFFYFFDVAIIKAGNKDSTANRPKIEMEAYQWQNMITKQ